MDKDSEESKEVDAALRAQCTCGGVAGYSACTPYCAIFRGTVEEADDRALTQVLPQQVGGPFIEQRGEETHYLAEAGEYGSSMRAALKKLAESEGPVKKAHRQHAVSEEPKKYCPSCGTDKITFSEEDKEVSFFEGNDKIGRSFKVIAGKCEACDLQWLDHHAEEAEMQAIYKLLYGEVVRLQRINKDLEGMATNHKLVKVRLRELLAKVDEYLE